MEVTKTMQKIDKKVEDKKNINDLFIRAARDGKLWQVKSLINICNIYAKDGYGKSALDYVIKNRHSEIFIFIQNRMYEMGSPAFKNKI